MVSGQLGQLLELGRIFIQFSSLHLEFKEFLLCPFSAHDILEILGKVVDNSVPNPFVGVSPSCAYVAIQLCGYLFDPQVHFGPPKVSEKQHRSGHRVIHDPSLFVDPLVDAPTDHEFFHFIPFSREDVWFLSNHLVR